MPFYAGGVSARRSVHATMNTIGFCFSLSTAFLRSDAEYCKVNAHILGLLTLMGLDLSHCIYHLARNIDRMHRILDGLLRVCSAVVPSHAGNRAIVSLVACEQLSLLNLDRNGQCASAKLDIHSVTSRCMHFGLIGTKDNATVSMDNVIIHKLYTLLMLLALTSEADW
eukprot:6197396-Pleurochrysis_carterae.AAC.2